MHHPELHLIPKIMCQDDVENYFSLQRARVSGEKPTTLQFFESSASLETELLSAEMTDTQGTCGSYDMTALPNLVSIPLIIRNHVVMTIAMTHSAPSDIMCSQSALMMY